MFTFNLPKGYWVLFFIFMRGENWGDLEIEITVRLSKKLLGYPKSRKKQQE